MEGAQVKVNLLLDRLPRLRETGVAPEAAFGGTFHVNETYDQLESARAAAERGEIPDPLPAEIYCHSITDDSILAPRLRGSGAHTLTVFGLHVPHRLVAGLDRAGVDTVVQDLSGRLGASVLVAERISSLALRLEG